MGVVSPCGRPQWLRPPRANRHRCSVSQSDRRPLTPTDQHLTPSYTQRWRSWGLFSCVCVGMCVCVMCVWYLCVTLVYWGRSDPLCLVMGCSECPPEAGALCGGSWCSWSSADQPSSTPLCYGTCRWAQEAKGLMGNVVFAETCDLRRTTVRYLLVNLSGSSSRARWKSRLSSASMPRPK